MELIWIFFMRLPSISRCPSYTSQLETWIFMLNTFFCALYSPFNLSASLHILNHRHTINSFCALCVTFVYFLLPLSISIWATRFIITVSNAVLRRIFFVYLVIRAYSRHYSFIINEYALYLDRISLTRIIIVIRWHGECASTFIFVYTIYFAFGPIHVMHSTECDGREEGDTHLIPDIQEKFPFFTKFP